MKSFYSSSIKPVLSMLLLLVAAVQAHGHDFESGGIYYNYNGDGKTVSVAAKDRTQSWMAYANAVVVPIDVEYDGVTYTVTAVADSAFYSCPSLRTVTLPASISSTIPDGK